MPFWPFALLTRKPLIVSAKLHLCVSIWVNFKHKSSNHKFHLRFLTVFQPSVGYDFTLAIARVLQSGTRLFSRKQLCPQDSSLVYF